MIEWLQNINNTVFLRDAAELLTIYISIIGIVVLFLHYLTLRRNKHPLGKRLQFVFITDILVYIVTFLMGVGLYYDIDLLIHYDIILRPVVLCVNVIAAWRLYDHIRRL